MASPHGLNGSCPLGHHNCPLPQQLEQLREECNRLLQLSITDPLTGYFNYRHLMTSLDQEMERTRRSGMPTGLIMIDLDHFKRVNDNYGHHAGDTALQWTSGIWRENIRRIDIPCRYGGEEFAIVLPGTGLSDAVHLAERLRKILSESPLRYNGDLIELTASFGAVAYKGQNGCSAQSVLDCADQMLIRAKLRGRNLVCSEPVDLRKPLTEVTAGERAELFQTRGRIESPPCLEQQ